MGGGLKDSLRDRPTLYCVTINGLYSNGARLYKSIICLSLLQVYIARFHVFSGY